MRSWALLFVVPYLVLAAGPDSACAADHPLSSGKLDMKRSNGKAQITFSSKDPALLFPGVGSADDPGTGSPGGALIELLCGVGDVCRINGPNAGCGSP